MKYLVLLNPKAGADRQEFIKLGLVEERQVWKLYMGEIIREMYFQPEPLRVALVFEADGIQAVRDHLETLPMVAAGLFDVDVMHFGPWSPFAALFAPTGADEVP